MAEQNFLEMSDEDLMNMPTPSFDAPVAEDPVVVVADEVVADPVVEVPKADDAEDEPANPLSTPDEDGEPDEGEAPKDGGTPAAEASKPESGEPVDKVVDKAENTPAENTAENKAIDYEAEYKKLLAPFKANGKDVTVASVEDAVALMQMGANYNKKMAALKPNLKLMKMLENNNLLNEEKLNFLIDLDKKVPGAINKLVKDSGIDPMDIDADKASAYRQTAYAVDDKEIELDTVLEEIQGSPAYNRTLEVVGNKWDVASKQVIAKEPQLLRVINDHIASGVYDLISTEIERERMFGRLKSVTDLEAYRQVGDSIQARGGFNHLFQKNDAPNQPAVPVIVQPKPVVEDTALKDKKRAASPTKPVAPTSLPADFNPLGLSDDDFAKMAAPRYR